MMSYPKTGNEVFVSFSLSNTMFSGLGKGTITREEVSADYLKDLFQKYGVMVSAKPEQRKLLERVNTIYDLGLDIPGDAENHSALGEKPPPGADCRPRPQAGERFPSAGVHRGRISGGHLQLCEVLCPEPAL